MTVLQQHTIDVGIDLGTTNSSIAIVVDGQPRLVENNRSQTWTPSAVRIRRSGAVEVGLAAYQQREILPDDVAVEFKRWMGSSRDFLFQSAGRRMTAPQLSSAVLTALRGDVEQRLGLSLAAAVITVPAAFGLSQCKATQDAAVLAGISQAPLLQEPVAASLAYGYSEQVAEGTWLVYDLGGGTFDLALVGIVDGQIRVLDHEGDNYLGGKDLDWLLVEGLLVPNLAKEYSVSSFVRGNPERHAVLALLKAKAEDAKIQLSRSDTVSVTVEPGRYPLLDDRGREIDVDLTIRRDELESVIGQPVARTIDLARALISRNKGAAPRTILLVGGPTLTPSIRTLVSDALQIPISTAANPLSVVAEGAALYAAAQPLSAVAPSSGAHGTRSPSAVAIFRYVAMTEDDVVPVACSLSGVVESVAGMELSSVDGRWSSPVIPLINNAAVTRVPLAIAGANAFRARFTDDRGNPVPVSPDQFSVYRGLTAAAAPLSRSLGIVVVAEGSGRKTVEWLLYKGALLPASTSHEFRTTLELDPSGPPEVVGIYIVEGESRRPERNNRVGHLDILNTSVTHMVPAGSPIEIQLDVNASRLLAAKVHIAVTDQLFPIQVQMEPDDPSLRTLSEELLAEQERLQQLSTTMTSREVASILDDARVVSAQLRAASEADPSDLQQAASRLRELQQRLDEHEAHLDLPRAKQEARAQLATAADTITLYGLESHSRRLELLRTQLSIAEEADDLGAIERASTQLSRIRFEVLGGQPWFWNDWFESLALEPLHWTDPALAEALIRDGRSQQTRGDTTGLRHSTLSLYSLAPNNEGSFAKVALRRV